MSSHQILLVEDCALLRQSLVDSLGREFKIDSAGDAESALLLLQKQSYDLILVDVGLPQMDGYKFCARLKAMPGSAETTVIFLSGRSEVEDKLIGFSVGGKDFILKPCDPRELKARIHSHLNEKIKNKENTALSNVGVFRVELAQQRIDYMFEGKYVGIDLSPFEFKLLYFFLSHTEHVLTRDQLLDKVWGDSRNVTDRSVDAVVSKLRKKLGPYSNLLKSVRGEGYRFSRAENISPKSA